MKDNKYEIVIKEIKEFMLELAQKESEDYNQQVTFLIKCALQVFMDSVNVVAHTIFKTSKERNEFIENIINPMISYYIQQIKDSHSKEKTNV